MVIKKNESPKIKDNSRVVLNSDPLYRGTVRFVDEDKKRAFVLWDGSPRGYEIWYGLDEIHLMYFIL